MQQHKGQKYELCRKRVQMIQNATNLLLKEIVMNVSDPFNKVVWINVHIECFFFFFLKINNKYGTIWNVQIKHEHLKITKMLV